jgi:K+/H+ antiporter YhaU regulatory subunit KhtT
VLAITSLLLIVAISLVVTRVATVVLTATGMSRSAARFQARSALSGSGFTTRESEQVVEHPVRRKVIAQLMLLGNAGIVAAATSTILGFRGGSWGHQWWRMLELFLGLMALLAISRSDRVDQRLTALISRMLRRFTDLPSRDLDALLDLSGDFAVSELSVKDGDWIAARSLAELALRDEGVVVLGLRRCDGRYVGAPTGETVVHPEDVLVVYGRGALLRELDDRPRGEKGDLAHLAAVAFQERYEREERTDDAESEAA